MNLNLSSKRRSFKTGVREIRGVKATKGISSDSKWNKAMEILDTLINSGETVNCNDFKKVIEFLDTKHGEKPISTLKQICAELTDTCNNVADNLGDDDIDGLKSIGLDLEELASLDNTFRVNNIYRVMHERSVLIKLIKVLIKDTDSIKEIISNAMEAGQLEATDEVITALTDANIIADDNVSTSVLKGFKRKKVGTKFQDGKHADATDDVDLFASGFAKNKKKNKKTSGLGSSSNRFSTGGFSVNGFGSGNVSKLGRNVSFNSFGDNDDFAGFSGGFGSGKKISKFKTTNKFSSSVKNNSFNNKSNKKVNPFIGRR